MFSKNSDSYFVDNQMSTKEALPVWIMPPFLLCKDNTFLSEMQIPFFRADDGSGAREAKNCYIWGVAIRWREGRISRFFCPLGIR